MSSAELRSNQSNVTIVAADGYRLGARLFAPRCSSSLVSVAVINSGAGLGQQFYAAFAEYLASHGVPTLTYDYRGIGESKPPTLRGFAADVEMWGSKDCAAVVNWMKSRFPESRLAVVGHSVGAIVTGFVNNGRLIDDVLTIGGHTGYWGDYRLAWRVPMFLMWHTVLPVATVLNGYFPGRRMRLGDDLPRGVALQWAGRLRPDLWWNLREAGGAPDHVRIQAVRSRFAALHCNAFAFRLADDPFASASATTRLKTLFENCRFMERTFQPEQLGRRRGGHFAYFNPRYASPLWTQAHAWLTR